MDTKKIPMDRIKQECRLCDTIISDESFKVIEDDIKDIFNIPLLKLPIDYEFQNVMCTVCFSKLRAALNFKSTCHHTDNSIIPYVDVENPKLVDLKEVYAKEIESEQGDRMLDNRNVCRLCLQPMDGDYKQIHEVPVDSIQIYIPEINFAITTNPAICLTCYDALHEHSTFIRDCLEMEKKRNIDIANIEDKLLTDPRIKTEEIEIKSEETDDETLCYLEKKKNDEGDTSFHDLIDCEESKGLYGVDDLKRTKIDAQAAVAICKSEEGACKATSESPSAGHQLRHKTVSGVKVNGSDFSDKKHMNPVIFKTKRLNVQEYQCDKCNYNTKIKRNFGRHKLLHEDPSKVRWFTCDKCDYKSILKCNLEMHQLKHKHPSEVQTYKCGECDYKSNRKQHLKRHQLRHSDPLKVQMYECDKCKFKTKYKKSLMGHYLTHKDPSEGRVFRCDECDYKSTQKGHFLTHQTKHKDPSVQMYSCDECDYKSIDKTVFNRHQLIHKDPLEVQMYKCDKCKFKTKRKTCLERHFLIHKDPAELKMYKCDKCEFITKHKWNFAQHCLRHK